MNKQEARRSYCSHKKQFKSINIFAHSYDYTVLLWKRSSMYCCFFVIVSLWINGAALHIQIVEFLLPKDD